ncbi:MAG: hypothetical protein JNK85_20855 [Verrucomicrobiales bacterium]|nr:hypothetical protein [Verrucomicrobiales bacterium]
MSTCSRSRSRWWFLLATVVAMMSRPAKADPVSNPALLYWQAFGMMPTLSEAERQIHDHRRTVPVDDAYAAVAHRYDEAFRLVRKAATLKGTADWGIDLSEGPEALLPHLAKAKSVASAAQFRMRYFVAQGQAGEAVRDAVGALALGRHLGRDSVLISTLVQIAIDAIVSSAVAEHFYGLDAAAAGQLLAGLESIPKPTTISECVDKGERSFGRWFRARIEAFRASSGGDEAKVLAEIRELFARNIREEKDYELADQFIREAGGTAEAVYQAALELEAFYDELTAITKLPRETYAAAADAFFARVSSGKNPLVKELLPAMKRAREKEFRAEARLGLLRAGLRYRQHGEDGWRSVPDPFGSGPFAFTRFSFQGKDRGFQLASGFEGDPREVLIFVEQDGPPFRVSGTQPGRAVEAP